MSTTNPGTSNQPSLGIARRAILSTPRPSLAAVPGRGPCRSKLAVEMDGYGRARVRGTPNRHRLDEPEALLSEVLGLGESLPLCRQPTSGTEMVIVRGPTTCLGNHYVEIPIGPQWRRWVSS